MNKILVLDPFVETPSNNCFNQLADWFPQLSFRLFQPSQNDISNLENKRSFAAILLLGSASHVSENLDWHHSLTTFHLEQLKMGIPTLGICFGHQLLASSFGATVEFYKPDEEKIEGFREIEFQNKKYILGVSHRQIVTSLDPNQDLQNVSQSAFPNDIIVHKNYPFWGTQAHPEGSDYFLKNTCNVLDPVHRKICLRDGKAFIQAFFSEFKIL